MYLMVFLNLFNTYGALNLLKTEKWEKMCTCLPIDYAPMFIFAPSNKTRFFQNLIYKINTQKTNKYYIKGWNKMHLKYHHQ